MLYDQENSAICIWQTTTRGVFSAPALGFGLGGGGSWLSRVLWDVTAWPGAPGAWRTYRGRGRELRASSDSGH